MTSFPAGDVITLVSRAKSGRDSDGNRMYSESFTQQAGGFAPGGSSEQTQGQDQVIDQPSVYFPPPVPDLNAIDAIVIDAVIVADEIVSGERYEVDGSVKPWKWQSTGEEAGLFVRLKRVTG